MHSTITAIVSAIDKTVGDDDIADAALAHLVIVV